MFKGLSRLWWRSVKQSAKRIGKAQQSQSKKLVKSLLAPTPKRTRPKTGPKAVKPRTQQAPALRTSSTPSKKPSRLPGRWMVSYYSSFPESGTLPARRMTYWLYIPDRIVPSSMPLVVMLHGCEQTATQFADGTRMNHLAEEKGFAVLYPQQSLRGHPQRCWPWYEKAIQEGGGEVELIAGTIDKVMMHYPIDTTRIYIAGLSAGAAMAHIMALTYPHRIAAVGLHSGPVFGAGHTRMGAYGVMQSGSARASDDAMREVLKKSGTLPKMPAILIQGRADKVVRSINQTQLAQQFITLNQLRPAHATAITHKLAGRAKNNPANAYQIQDYVERRKLLLRVCEIQNLEHAWSGGDCALKYNACNGPDASKMMWNFFARHRRLGTAPT